jgi:hypothetical protein
VDKIPASYLFVEKTIFVTKMENFSLNPARRFYRRPAENEQ